MHLVFYILMIFLCFHLPASAASFRTVALESGDIALLLSGEIASDDGHKFLSQINNATRNGKKVSLFALNSLGGSVSGGQELAFVVRRMGISTFVPSGAKCASACFMPFAAGAEKWAATDAEISVHSASLNNVETDSANTATIKISRFLDQLGVPAHIIGVMVKTPANKTSKLTQEELQLMGVRFTKPVKDSSQVTITETNRKLARELNIKGIKLIKQGRASDAVTVLTNAMRAYPLDAEVLGNLGYAQYLLGDFGSARETLMIALKLKPQRAITWSNLGLTLAELNDTKWASECFANYYAYRSNKKDAANQLYLLANDNNRSVKVRSAVNIALQQLGI